MGNKGRFGGGAKTQVTQVAEDGRQLSSIAGPGAQVDGSKLTHGFWLQRYSGLHQQSEGADPCNETSCGYHMLAPAERFHSQPASPQRRGMFARWRSQFTKAMHQSESTSQSPKRSSACLARPTESPGVCEGAANKDDTSQQATGVQVSGKPQRCQRRGHASRLLRSLSSSTSALLSPLGSVKTGKTAGACPPSLGAVNESAMEPRDAGQRITGAGNEHTKERKQQPATNQQRQPGAGSWLSLMLSSPRLFRRAPATKQSRQAWDHGDQVSEWHRKEEDRVAWLESEQLQLGSSGQLASINRRAARQTATGAQPIYANEAQVRPHCRQAPCKESLSQPTGIPEAPPDEPLDEVRVAPQMVHDKCIGNLSSGPLSSVDSVPSGEASRWRKTGGRGEPLIEQLDVSLALSASSGSGKDRAARQEEGPIVGGPPVLQPRNDVGTEERCVQKEVMLSLIQRRGSSGSSRTSSPSPASSWAASGCSSPEPASTASSAAGVLPQAPDSSKPQRAQLARHQPLRCSSGPEAAGRRQQLVRAPSSGVQQLKSNFKKQVERQQSVDSYRIARELRNKQRRQRDQRHKHQSNEAIPSGASVALKGDTLKPLVGEPAACVGPRICLTDHVANDSAPTTGNHTAPQDAAPHLEEGHQQTGSGGPPAPPKTLSLMASRGTAAPPFVVGSFSGSITPTYMTHHLQSPYRGMPAPKKYSNASTVSSSLCADTSTRCQTTTTQNSGCSQAGAIGFPGGLNGAGGGSDTESSIGLAGVTGSPSPLPAHGHEDDFLSGMLSSSLLQHQQPHPASPQQQLDSCLQTKLMQEEATRRAQLAEHIYDNKCGLGEDMKFLASLPELCDITFLVGETREPVCAVKSVLAARSRVFHKILFGHRRQARLGPQANTRFPSQAALTTSVMAGKRASADRKTSSPRLSTGTGVAVQEVGSRRGSPHQWSVTENASGYGATGPSPSSVADPQQADSATATAREHLALKSGGRVSLASERAESGSLSQASAGSQQPLIVGPGQTATPAPLHKAKKKGSVKGLEQHGSSRLSRMFMKRASDPNIKHQNPHHQLHHQVSVGSSKTTNHQVYIDKISWCQMSTTMIIEEFEPDVFRQLIEYIHTGCVLLQARTLLGLLNAADYYGLEQLRRACLRFVSCCITVDTVCSLLSTAERYIQYKCTKSIVQKVLEFVDTHANEVFKLNAFGLLPEHVVRLILAREGLQAEEQAKYNGVYTWCEHYCRSYELASIADVMRNFLHLIQFHKISRQVLLNEIYPTRTVPDNVILIALAEQVRPRFEASAGAGQVARRMTLPNPGCLVVKEPLLSPLGPSQHPGLRGHSSSSVTATSQQQQQQQPAAPLTKPQADRKSSATRLRQGSIAQVSLSNVKRLSHKFSIKRRRSAVAENGAATRRDGKQLRPSLARQQSALCAVAAASSVLPASGGTPYSWHQAERESIQLGKLILDAHLRERAHEQELVERARRQPIMPQPPTNDHASSQANKSSSKLSSSTGGSTGVPTLDSKPTGSSSQQQPAPVGGQQPTSGQQASTKKSFKDFRSISRRIFMRRSSTRQLYSQQVQQQSSLPNSSTSPIQSSELAHTAPTSGPKQKSQLVRRNLLRIKRSDTVFETAPGASY